MVGEIIKMIPFDLSTNLNHTWFFDLDGTILKHNSYLHDEPEQVLPGVKELWKSIPEGDMIIIVTARPSSVLERTEAVLKENNLRYDKIIMDLPYGERIVVNDIKPEFGLKTAIAWNVERDKGYDKS